MYSAARSSIISWWILIVLALIVWYRNFEYDRVFSSFLFVLALMQLIQFVAFNYSSPQETGASYFMCFWLQCLFLSAGAFWLLYNTPLWAVAAGIFALEVIIFAIMIFFACTSTFTIDMSDRDIQWYNNGGDILGDYGILYIFALIIPMFLILLWYVNYPPLLMLIFTFILVVVGGTVNSGMLWSSLALAIGFIYVLSTSVYYTI